MAKITGIEIGRSIHKQYGIEVLNLMPTNLYGPYDNFSELDSHVIPGLISRMHESKRKNEKEILIWGTGTPLREFMYAEDLANAIEFLLDKDLAEDKTYVESLLYDIENELYHIVNPRLNVKKPTDAKALPLPNFYEKRFKKGKKA